MLSPLHLSSRILPALPPELRQSPIDGERANPTRQVLQATGISSPKTPIGPRQSPTLSQRIEMWVGTLVFQLSVLGTERSLKRVKSAGLSYQQLAEGILETLNPHLAPCWDRPWPLKIVVLASSDAECRCFPDGHISIGDRRMKKIFAACVDPTVLTCEVIDAVSGALMRLDFSDIKPDHLLAAVVTREMLGICGRHRMLYTLVQICFWLIGAFFEQCARAVLRRLERVLFTTKSKRLDNRVESLGKELLQRAGFNPKSMVFNRHIAKTVGLTNWDKIDAFFSRLTESLAPNAGLKRAEELLLKPLQPLTQPFSKGLFERKKSRVA